MKLLNNFIMKKYIFIILSFLAITSCKSLKQTFDSHLFSTKPDILIDKIIENDIDFNTIYFKRAQFTVSEDNDKKSFRGSIFIKKNKQIIVSITPVLGIELFKVIVEPNSIIIVDKMKKEVQHTNFSYLEDNFNMSLDFYTLQSILTNSFFVYPFSLPKNLFKFELTQSSDNQFLLQSKKITHNRNIFQQRFTGSNSINKISKIEILNITENILLNILYSDFKNIYSDKYFPNEVSLSAIHKNSNMNLTIQYSQIEIDGSSSLSPSIPDSYVKVYR